MESLEEKLSKAIEFVRQSFLDSKINLDYSISSVRHFDNLFDTEFKKGKLRNSNGGFAQHQGIIMAGVAGYIAEVITKNTSNSAISFDEKDENWSVNFTVTSENGWTIQPGIRVMKRAYNGKEDELYAYVVSTIKYFNQPKSDSADNNRYIQEVHLRDIGENIGQKPWWKFW